MAENSDLTYNEFINQVMAHVFTDNLQTSLETQKTLSSYAGKDVSVVELTQEELQIAKDALGGDLTNQQTLQQVASDIYRSPQASTERDVFVFEEGGQEIAFVTSSGEQALDYRSMLMKNDGETAAETLANTSFYYQDAGVNSGDYSPGFGPLIILILAVVALGLGAMVGVANSKKNAPDTTAIKKAAEPLVADVTQAAKDFVEPMAKPLQKISPEIISQPIRTSAVPKYDAPPLTNLKDLVSALDGLAREHKFLHSSKSLVKKLEEYSELVHVLDSRLDFFGVDRANFPVEKEMLALNEKLIYSLSKSYYFNIVDEPRFYEQPDQLLTDVATALNKMIDLTKASIVELNKNQDSSLRFSLADIINRDVEEQQLYKVFADINELTLEGN